VLNEKTLDIATSTYYWKPMAAFFRSMEMGFYCDNKVTFDGPVLDLGCGDGGILSMLDRMELIKGEAYGMDIDFRELTKAMSREQHKGIYQGDANCLPFTSDYFSSIICNGVLSSIPQGVTDALGEISRVLKKDGMITITVPTDQFIDVLLLPKIIGFFSSSMRSRYVEKVNNRMPHFTTLKPAEWKEQIESQGLKVETMIEFMPPRAGTIWNILTMQIFRVFGLLKFVKASFVSSMFASIEKAVFRLLYSSPPTDASKAGYVFLVCRKQ